MNSRRAGIFNRFWSTMGGGEQLAAAYALALTSTYSVELITTTAFDLEMLSQRLGKPELANLPVRVIGNSPTAATEISADYDLFLNHSFTSEDVNLSTLGVYVCMFPQTFRRPNADNLRDRFTCRVSPTTLVSQHGDLLELPPKSAVSFEAADEQTLTFIAQDSHGSIRLLDDHGNEITSCELGSRKREFVKFSIPCGKSSLLNDSDRGPLQVLSPRLGDGMRVFVEGGSTTGSESPAFVSSYDLILSISQFTESFVQRRWGTESVVHYPPVSLRPFSSRKENVILSVGRFFAEEVGHCKQQLRMVHAFRQMVDQGLSGWRLSLVGGCDSQYKEYALAVRKAAKGYPIDVYLNADLEKLNEEFARASIYWHATGLGTDIVEHPDRAEHFGIAPIEAMSTGAIPVVFGFGGPQEIANSMGTGFVFHDVSELVAVTTEIINLDRRSTDLLRQKSIDASQNFCEDKFIKRLATLLNGPACI